MPRLRMPKKILAYCKLLRIPKSCESAIKILLLLRQGHFAMPNSFFVDGVPCT